MTISEKTDIVGRLKEQSGWNERNKYLGHTGELLWDAIEEIERLRALSLHDDRGAKMRAALECVDEWIKSRGFVPSVDGVKIDGDPIIGPNTRKVFDTVAAALAEQADDDPRYRSKGSRTIPLATLKWWRELVDLNPSDLAPRLDAVIVAEKDPK